MKAWRGAISSRYFSGKSSARRYLLGWPQKHVIRFRSPLNPSLHTWCPYLSTILPPTCNCHISQLLRNLWNPSPSSTSISILVHWYCCTHTTIFFNSIILIWHNTSRYNWICYNKKPTLTCCPSSWWPIPWLFAIVLQGFIILSQILQRHKILFRSNPRKYHYIRNNIKHGLPD